MDLTNYKYEPPSIENLREKGLKIVEPQKENEPPPSTDLMQTNKSEGDDLLNRILLHSEYLINLSQKDIQIIDLIQIDGVPILYKKGLTFLMGAKGTHKSRLIETILTGAFNENNEYNFANIKCNEALQFLLIDSERDDMELAVTIKFLRSLIDPANYLNFDVVSFLRIPRPERLIALRKIIDFKLKSNDKHLVIVFDVSSDLLENFNSLEQTNALFDYVMLLKNDFNCSFILIIHTNPGATGSFSKGRGHLGTEGGNKANIELLISKNKTTNLVTLQTTKIRRMIDWERHFEYYNGLLKIVSKDDILTKQTEIENELKIGLVNLIGNKSIKQKDCIDFLRSEGLGRNDARDFLNKYSDKLLTNEKILRATRGLHNSLIFSIETEDAD